jgi:hypothetical protein
LEKQFVGPRGEKIHIFTSAKKGDIRLCSNYRTIALHPHASKILLRIIQGRLATYIEREISEEQTGFRKGGGTRDQIANIR